YLFSPSTDPSGIRVYLLSTVFLSSAPSGCSESEGTNLHAVRMKVTPLEISTSTEVSMTARISIRSRLASASVVVE
ncbi:MAG: hypothetical protein ACFFDI_20040, partial [Promethearchaeota archaeon]